jgi:hypothetical protein
MLMKMLPTVTLTQTTPSCFFKPVDTRETCERFLTPLACYYISRCHCIFDCLCKNCDEISTNLG